MKIGRPLLITSGEPAGIGPDVCLSLANSTIPLVVLGDKSMLKARAKHLGLDIVFEDYKEGCDVTVRQNHLTILSLTCPNPVTPGLLNPDNSPYVIDMLKMAIDRCRAGEFSALVTAPVNKSVINEYGLSFSGHTEFLAQRCGVETVVMMLACPQMKMALVTTHLPLKDVPKMITKALIDKVIRQLHRSLQEDFGVISPKIVVAGLNPHAGESGYLGEEEIHVISPALEELRQHGLDVVGPLPADTLFSSHNSHVDAFVAMYHDQGLPVLKYAGFGKAVNITLGLPIVRTSVDHGTAIDLAGQGLADPGSLIAAVKMAAEIVHQRDARINAHDNH